MRIGLAATTVAALMAALPAAGQTRDHALTVAVWTRDAATDAEIAALVAQASAILTAETGCTGVTLSLAGVTAGFPQGVPSVIDTEADFLKLRRTGASINVVDTINWCDRAQPNVGGCTRRGTFPIAVVIGASAAVQPVKWVHEIGHSQGLPDRCDDRPSNCASDIGWVMAGVLDTRNTRIGDAECESLGGRRNFPVIETQSDAPLPLDAFLMQEWRHGIPFAAIRSLTDEQVNAARDFAFSAPGPMSQNALTVIALRGDDADLDRMLDMLRVGAEAGAPPDRVRAVAAVKRQVPLSLGLYLSHAPSDRGIAALRALSNPRGNADFAFTGPDTTFEAAEALSLTMARNALIATAFVNPALNDPAALVEVRDVARNANDRGLFDLRVGEDFFPYVEGLAAQVAAEGVEAVLGTAAPD